MKREERVHVALNGDGTVAVVIRGDLRKAKGLVYHPDGLTVEMIVSVDGSPSFAPVVEARLLWDDSVPKDAEEGRGS